MVARSRPLHPKRHMAARLKLENLHLNKPQDMRNNVLWTDEIIVDKFGHNVHYHIYRKPNTAHQLKHLIPAVKCSGGAVKS